MGDSLADDVVAETFLAAFRRLTRYDTAHRDAPPVAVRHRRQPHRQTPPRRGQGVPGAGQNRGRTRWRRATPTEWRPACRPRRRTRSWRRRSRCCRPRTARSC
ncbi:hypothetical protein [Nonomuraea dietziae]|uniref:hypothetical protein n=1 Tax=Nonomuraea dietziae TaxID=65515 RepID=UPI0031E1C2A7